MKLLLALVGFVVLASHGAECVRATLDELKAFEKFSPYPWTQWLKFHPGSAAAIAIAPAPGHLSISAPDVDDYTEEESEEEEEDSDDLQKRATLPEVIDTLKESDDKFSSESDDEDNSIVQVEAAKKAEKEQAKLAKKAQKAALAALTTKKPSIIDVEPDFWEPPPSIAPNVTIPLPPGYWASKKAMFISKLFAALAESVLNSTGPPEQVEVTTTTPSPRQVLLEEINRVLLNDNVRSAPVPDADDDDSDEDDESDEDSDEVAAAIVVVTPAPKPALSPYLTQKLDFLGKLSSAIAAKPAKPTKAPSPWAWGKPTKAPKKPVKGKKLKGKKGEVAATPAPGLDYDALAKALLANGAGPSLKSNKA